MKSASRTACAHTPTRQAKACLALVAVLLAAACAHASGICDEGQCERATAVVTDASGRIVVAGVSEPPPDWDRYYPTLWRLNNDGTPDLTFGDGGVVLGTTPGEAVGILIAADGTLLLPGLSDGRIAIMRCADDGSAIEPVSESNDGSADSGVLSGMSMGRSAVIDRNGGIVVVDSGPDGSGTPGQQPLLRRFNPDGTRDVSFGVSATAPPGEASVRTTSLGIDMTIDEIGRIVVVGRSEAAGSQASAAVWRINPDGAPDGTFGDGGRVTDFRTELVGYDSAEAVTIDNAGRILVAGRTYLSAPPDYSPEAEFVAAVGIWCFTSDGEPDESFGDGGRVARSHDSRSTGAAAIRIDSEGRIVVLSFALDRGFAVLRFMPDGEPDEGFGGDGLSWQAALPVEAGLIPSALTFDSSERIVLAGSAWGNGFDMAVWRLNLDGTLDRAFGTDGFVSYDRGAGFGGVR